MNTNLLDWRDILTIFGTWMGIFGILGEFTELNFHYRLLTILIPIIIVLFCNQIKIWNNQQFKLIKRQNNAGTATEYIKQIETAKKYIWVTHFRSEMPTNSYLETLELVRKSGVKIRRIVNVLESDLVNYNSKKWIVDELEKQNTEHKFLNFEELKLSYEIISIDGKMAAIALPTKNSSSQSELPCILSSTNKEFIECIESMFTEYWKS